ncbi:hypothetical protein FOZ62_018426, partial [Perkinsus olseni]
SYNSGAHRDPVTGVKTNNGRESRPWSVVAIGGRSPSFAHVRGKKGVLPGENCVLGELFDEIPNRVTEVMFRPTDVRRVYESTETLEYSVTGGPLDICLLRDLIVRNGEIKEPLEIDHTTLVHIQEMKDTLRAALLK